jgi:hypothetical protein
VNIDDAFERPVRLRLQRGGAREQQGKQKLESHNTP